MPGKNTNRRAGDAAARQAGICKEQLAPKPIATTAQSQKKSWRDVLPIHPAADLFPLMPPDELKALGEDIKKNGLVNPIVTVCYKKADGPRECFLVDGRNRLDAMEMAGLEPRLDLIRGNYVLTTRDDWEFASDIPAPQSIDSDPWTFVVSINIHRRHLTTEKKRELIGELLKAQPEKSNRQIADTMKVDDKTVGAVRRELEGRAEIPHVETRTDTKGRKQPAAKHKPKPPAGNDVDPQESAAWRKAEVQTDLVAKKSTTEWADILGPAREFEAAVTKTRSLYDVPIVGDGAKEIALLSIFKEEQRFAFEPVMRALERLSELTDWSHHFFVCDRVESEFFDWRQMPLRQYSSFQDFYRRELEATWGKWGNLQHTWAEVAKAPAAAPQREAAPEPDPELDEAIGAFFASAAHVTKPVFSHYPGDYLRFLRRAQQPLKAADIAPWRALHGELVRRRCIKVESRKPLIITINRERVIALAAEETRRVREAVS